MEIRNKKESWFSQGTIDADGYFRHDCGCIIMRVDKDSVLHNCYCFCKKCKKEIKLPDITNGQIVQPKPEIRIISA